MALSSVTDINGSIQKYFEDAWMEMPQDDFKTPLAGSEYLDTATIPKNAGQYAEFRKFAHMTIEAVSATDDTPKTYGENAEPTSARALSSTIFRVPLEIIPGYVELGGFHVATDPIDLVAKNKDEAILLIRRTVHRLTNGRAVKAITYNTVNADVGTAVGSGNVPSAFKSIFATGVEGFEDVLTDTFFTANDFKRAVAIMRNSRIPGVKGVQYVCFADNGVLATLSDDAEFRDSVKRHADMLGKYFASGDVIAEWEGCRFILQDDEYRCNLAASGGALTTRQDAGAVHVCTILGKHAMGYVDFGGSNTLARRTLMPKWKVQDTSKTGTGPTVGWRMAYQAVPLDNTRGINVVGCVKYNEKITDIAS